MRRTALYASFTRRSTDGEDGIQRAEHEGYPLLIREHGEDYVLSVSDRSEGYPR